MRSARVFAVLFLLTTLVLLAGEGSRGQDKDKKADDPLKPSPKAQLPKYFDKLGLTDPQRDEIVKLTKDYQERKAKLQEEIRKLDQELARKRVTVLNDEQRKKLIDLVAGPEPKAKADPKAKGNDK